MAGVVKIACLFALLCVFASKTECKPFFGTDWWCDLFCDDDDYDDPTNPTTTTLEDLIESIMDGCSDCRPNRRRRPQNVGPFNVVLPPSQTGLNLTMQNSGGSWIMNLLPWSGGTAPAVPAAAPAAPAAPAATTAAPAGATTAAAG